MSAEPSQIILSIHRSEPRFKSHTGGKVMKTLKNDGNFDGFCWFSAKSNSKLFRPDQENEHFSVNSHRKFLSWQKARRQVSKWISPLIQIPFILLISYFNDICCTFHLGKMFVRFLSVIFDIYFGSTTLVHHGKTFRWHLPFICSLLLAISFSKK